MASLFKPTKPIPLPPDAEVFTQKGERFVRIRDDGKTIVCKVSKDGTKYLKPAAKWYGRYRDANGKPQKQPLSSNKDAAKVMLGNLLKKREKEKSGIRDCYADYRRASLTDLTAEYAQYIIDKAATAVESHQTRRRCEIAFHGCGFMLLWDLGATGVERWLAERRALPKHKGGFGPASSNHYLKSCKAFGNWLVKSRRIPENPFRHLARVNVDVDIRHERRALTAEEFAQLLTAARSGKTFRKTTGTDRAFLYLVSAMTGLRASELASLTPESFALDADTPVVAVEAAYSKHRRRDEVPLHPDLIRELRPWLAEKPLNVPLWPGN